MKRFRRLLRYLGFAALMITAPAFADAPPDQYAPFDKNAKTILDQKTKIEWDRTVRKDTFALLTLQCNGSNVSGGRVPTVKELLTIVDEEPHLEYEQSANRPKFIDASAFPGTPYDGPFWSQTPGPTPDTVLGVDFHTGMIVDMPKSGQGYIRCMK